MSDAARPPGSNEPPESASAETAPGADDLRQVREILVGPERHRLADLEQAVHARTPTAEEVGAVLPEAIARRSRDDRRLASALAPTIEGAIETSVRKNPRPLTDAIFPLIGPAIRKSIQTSLASILESFNHALENSLSPRGLRWRWEARRTGRPFSEVVLSHTLVFRVEQVLLIHHETGLLLERAQAPAATSRDPELVSSMLAALQDFVRDSFASQSGDDGVQQVKFGDLTLLVAQGPAAILAALVRGLHPVELETELAVTLEKIHAQLAEPLAGFEGDVGVFAIAQPLLEACLGEQRRQPTGGRPRRFRPGLVVMTAAALFLAIWIVRSWTSADAEARAWERALTRLEQEPGIVLVARSDRGGRTRLHVLRDPDAREPHDALDVTGIDAERIDWRVEPYLSLEPALVAARVQRLLRPPATVAVALEAGTLRLSGSAHHDWVADARRDALAIAGVDRVVDRDLRDADASAFEADVAGLAEVLIEFRVRSVALDLESTEVRGLLARLTRLDDAASRAGRGYRIELRGSCSRTEWENGDHDFARRRAEAVRDLLVPRLAHATAITIATHVEPHRESGLAAEVRLRVVDAAAPVHAYEVGF